VQVQRILELAPATPEARRFRDWLDAHGDEDFQHAFHDAVDHWVQPRPPSPWARLLEQLEADPWLAATFVGVLVLLAIAALVPLPRVTAAHAQLLPSNQITVAAPDEGVVGPVVVHDGDPVKAGTLLYSWSADELQLRLLDASEALDEARRPLRDRANKVPEAGAALARLRAAEAQLARAQAELLREQKESAGEDLPQPPVDSEARFNLAWQEVQAAQEGLDVIARPGTLEELRINALSGAVRMLRERLMHRAVLAQSDGVVSGLSVREGDSVAEGQSVMRLDDRTHLRVVAQVTPQQAQSFRTGEPIEIAFEHVRKPAVIEGVFGYEVVAKVDNTDGALELGTEQVHLERPALSMLQLMFR
jgi:multidrug resistance efflux pump